MLTQALLRLRPGAKWQILGDTYAGITWLDQVQTLPTEAEVLAEMELLRVERAANAYIGKRQNAYPSIGDQLDALYHAGAFPADMAAKIAAVKAQFPKS
jgi:hypothetical protein